MSRILLRDNVTLCRGDGSSVNFYIKAHIGSGASCVVYHAVCEDKTEHLLKEYYPRNLDLERNEEGTLIVPEHKRNSFDKGLERFRNGNERQKEVRLSENLKNFTSNVQGYFYGNGTEYIDMTVFAGRTYRKVEGESLYDLMLRMRTLAQVIGYYHDEGLLHLDIKPDNIFVRPENETVEDVMLFDFDSVIEKSNKMTVAALSYTKDWAAPEQLLPYKRNSICEATDLFSIGEIIFSKIFGRHSTQAERRSFAEYDIDYNADIFKNVNPQVVPLIKELFRHTLCAVPSRRYQTACELVEQLDKIVALSDPKEPFIKKGALSLVGFFTGRDAEIEAIHEKFKETDTIFLSGIGGIGKSELAKHYAKTYENEYDAIIFAPFVNDVQMMITDDNYVPIYNFSQYPEEKPDEYFARKMRKLGELCDKRTLIIVDNLDAKDDDNLDKLLGLGCKMLVTTRADYSDVYSNSQIDIDVLADPFSVFNEYYKKPLSEDDLKCVDEIIEIVCGHTMTVELLAKQMMAGRVKPEKMLDKLKNGGVSDSGKEKVRTAKDGKLAMQSTYDHIQALFDLSKLDENEKQVLANLALIPHTGISTELFHDLCELEDYECINKLALDGWIRQDKDRDYISLHPLLSELIFHILNNMESLTSKYISNTATIKFWGNDKITDKHYAVDIFKHSLLLIDKYNFRSENAADFLRKVSTRIEHYDRPVNIERYYKKALSIRLDLFGENSVDVATSYFYLAKLYNNVGKFQEAEKYAQMALKVRESIYGARSDQYMLVLFELGHIFAWQKRYTESEKAYLQVEQYFMEAYDEETKTVLNCKLHLGDLYSRMKQYDKAIEVLQNCLTKKQLKYGADSLDSATVHYSLSVAYRDSKKIELSINHGEKALSIRLLKLNENHPSIAQSYSSLGMTYLFFNEFDKAEEYLLRALEIRKKIFGEEHQRTARSYFRLGLCFEQTKRYSQSIENYKSAIHIWNVLLMNDYMDKLEAEKRLCELQKNNRVHLGEIK